METTATHAIATDFGTRSTKFAYWDPFGNQLALMRLGHRDEPYIPSLFYLPSDGADVVWARTPRRCWRKTLPGSRVCQTQIAGHPC
jgi:hypothetical protein